MKIQSIVTIVLLLFREKIQNDSFLRDQGSDTRSFIKELSSRRNEVMNFITTVSCFGLREVINGDK